MLNAESAKRIPDAEEVSGQQGIELSRTPIELKSGCWILKVVPWIGGRIISMTHLPSGNTFELDNLDDICSFYLIVYFENGYIRSIIV